MSRHLRPCVVDLTSDSEGSDSDSEASTTEDGGIASSAMQCGVSGGGECGGEEEEVDLSEAIRSLARLSGCDVLELAKPTIDEGEKGYGGCV